MEAFSEQEYREMDRGALLWWLDAREFGCRDVREASFRSFLALERLDGLMGEW